MDLRRRGGTVTDDVMTQGARVLKTAFLLQPVRRGTLESMKVCVLFCLFFLTVANTQETEGVTHRDVLQNSDRVRVTSETELQNFFSGLTSDQTVILSSEQGFALSETLIIEVNGVTVRGQNENRTVITCPPNSNSSALVIRGLGIRLENLRFSDCEGAPAVVVTPVADRRRQQSTVTLLNVQFLGNGLQDSQVNGSAILVEPCSDDACGMPVLEMDRCRFEDNHGMHGGAVYAAHADLRLNDCTFSGNTASRCGGAVYANASGGNLIMRNTRFENNNATWNKLPERERGHEKHILGTGGAVVAFHPNRTIIQNVDFINNSACIGGGGLIMVYSDVGLPRDASLSFRMQDSLFDGNTAYCGPQEELSVMHTMDRVFYMGGGMAQTCDEHVRVEWNITETEFRNNRARFGGALHLMGAPDLPLYISSSLFRDNIALGGGGAIAVRTASLVLRSTTLRRNRALWGGAVVVWFRGSIFTVPDPDEPDRISIMEENTAVYGGGLQFAVGGSLELSALTIRNNTGYRYGGGIRCFAAHLPAMFSGIRVENNRAFVGGAIAFYAAASFKFNARDGVNSIIANNTASVGGGVYYDTGHYLPLNISIEDTVFTENKALAEHDAEIAALLEEGGDYTLYTGAPLVDPFKFSEYFEEQTVADILAQVSSGQGGGLYMTMANIQLFTLAEVIMDRVLVEGNEAVVGGGASIHFSDLYWDKGNEKHCFESSFETGTCQRFYFSNVEIRRNKAEYAGGLFTTHPKNIRLTCDVRNPELNVSFERVYTQQLTSEGRLHPERDLKCMTIADNEISDGASVEAADAGTSVHSLMIEGLDADGNLKEVASGQNLAIHCPNSNLTFCGKANAVIVKVKDAFNSTIARGIEDAHLELTVLSDNVVGDVRYTAANGTAVIDNTQAHGIGVRSNITIQTEGERRVEAVAGFRTRRCLPGEFNGRHSCIRCASQVYGFDPKRKCEKCEDNAICKGGAALVPKDGFYHSCPYSPQIHRCIHPEACTYVDRVEMLTGYYKDSDRVTEDLFNIHLYLKGAISRPEFPQYQQCAEGSEGVLCGSCQDGYGHSFRGSCEACPSEGKRSKGLLTLTVFTTFLMIGANCLVTLLSTRARIQLVHREMRDQNINNRPVLRRAGGHIHGERSVHMRFSRRATLTGQTSGLSDYQSKLMLTQQLVAAVQLTESLKILVNYLQVTSAAMRLPVDWQSVLNGFLSLQAALVGVTNEALSVPFECNFGEEHDLPPSILAIWTRVLNPVVALVALIGLYTLFWLGSHSKNKKVAPDSPTRSLSSHLITGVIVITIVAIYFSYIDWMREFLRIVNCVEVDTEDPDHPYNKYALQTGRKVWAEDTDLTCFQGDHEATGILGIMGLFLAALVIVFIIVWLPLNKKHETKTEFVARYWFIYQAYKKEWYTIPWEAVILIRKSLIAAVVVFSFQLGASLQASMCVGTLVVAHFIQVALRPFKVPVNHEYVPEYAGAFLKTIHAPKLAPKWLKLNNSLSLNALESASLMSSILVFYSAIILTDPNSSSSGMDAMSAFAFVFNLAFFFYMLYRLYCGFHVLVDLKLEISNPEFMATHENSLGFLHLIKKIAQVFRSTLRHFLSERERSDGQGIENEV